MDVRDVANTSKCLHVSVNIDQRRRGALVKLSEMFANKADSGLYDKNGVVKVYVSLSLVLRPLFSAVKTCAHTSILTPGGSSDT